MKQAGLTAMLTGCEFSDFSSLIHSLMNLNQAVLTESFGSCDNAPNLR